MFKSLTYYLISILIHMAACENKHILSEKVTASKILGNPDYQAISYSGYRGISRSEQPTVAEIKEDLLILSAMGIKLLRTYDVTYDHSPNLLKAISELKVENPDFEMYVMLGVWIDCKNAWTGLEPDHHSESEKNASEIERAVSLANKYPDIVKIIAVGNEAMIHWATACYVEPKVILKWVNYLQNLKSNGQLDKDLWITCSDNFASWGGGDPSYHCDELKQLFHSVDFIPLHTYPMHDTHYNPSFWGVRPEEAELSETEKIEKAMFRSVEYAKAQYYSVQNYMKSIGVDKPIHIGETGWATVSNENYGIEDSKAADEYKSAIYYRSLRKWCDSLKISCFFFEAFDEPWKDATNAHNSENHFGLFTVDGQAKLALWDLVDNGIFNGLGRNNHSISKTYKGSLDSVLLNVGLPPIKDAQIPIKFY